MADGTAQQCGRVGNCHIYYQYNDIKLPLCIFNGGTGNDFYSLLYGNITLENQIDKVLHSKSRTIDVGKCNNRYFLNGVGIGFEGAVAKRLIGVNKFSGKTSFLLSIFKEIFKYKEQEYFIKSDEFTISSKFLMISIANGTRYGGGFHVAPLAKPDDGFLDANFVYPINSINRLRYLPVIEKGKHLQLDFIKYFNIKKIIISSNKIIQAHLDGEYLENFKLEIEILPSHFNFIY
jgi:diacylglycerol kinase (ATP)